MKTAFVCALAVAFFSPVAVRAITIDTVPIGNPGNVGDFNSGIFGSVGSDYRIGTTEVTNAQYVEFLNAVAASDPNQLYNSNMSFYARGGIVRSGTDRSFTYSVKASVPGAGPGGTDYTYGDKPVVFVSWYDAARFVNWLENGATPGASTETGTYTMANGASVTRNAGTTWFLPTEDQWYKAAYYDGNGTQGSYYEYPTRSDDPPDNNPPAADTGNSANYYTDHFAVDDTYSLTDAGAYTLSPSAYGTFDQGGNVWEWTETKGTGTTRIQRGGAFDTTDVTQLSSSYRVGRAPTTENSDIGFRVASLPLLLGDYNADGIVDAADYVVWRKNLGQTVTLPNDSTPGSVTQADYNVWRTNFGQTSSSSGSGSLLASAVPEPSTCALFVALMCIVTCIRTRR